MEHLLKKRLSCFKHFFTVIVLSFAFSTTSAFANVQQQGKNFSVDLINESLANALKKVEKASGCKVIFTYDEVQNYTVNVRIKRQTVSQAMALLLKDKPFKYSINGKFVYVSKIYDYQNNIGDEIAGQAKGKSDETRLLEGNVTDEHNEPLPGANVQVSGTSIHTVCDANGKYRLVIPAGSCNVVYSFVGMQNQEIAFQGGRQDLLRNVALKENNTIDEVVVNGIFERKTESFTGSTSVIRKDELMRNGSQNILQNIRNIDPAFKIVENMDMGSDPNSMPDIQVRGQQSMPDIQKTYQGNPNQPLFILDGFETDLTTVYDLDMNRVETIVLLKDATAKAIYGARAANGVVVIETRKPKSGSFRISYKGDLNLTIPDLTGYNLCNAREKYEVEKTHRTAQDPWFREQYLNGLLAEITKGVDTDWLSQPLHTGIGQRHSVYLEGGDERIRYGVDLLLNQITGVMKGSNRKTFAGGFTLSYRYKRLLFKNQFNATLNTSNESPYGSFAEYTSLNPYWKPYDNEGKIVKVAGVTGGGGLMQYNIGNPMWNALIDTKNTNKYTSLTNNFYAEWQVMDNLKFIGRLGLSKTESNHDEFYPAAHTRYINYTDEQFFKRGSYTKGTGSQNSLRMDVTGNYNLSLGKNLFYMNAGVNLTQENADNAYFKVIGFPNDKLSFVAAGNEYEEDSRPSGYTMVSHELGYLAALNYSYDERYLADLSYRASASSKFGKDNRWGSFWSAGIGWNLHNEHFMKKAKWLKQFKLRASTGYTGAQNFSPFQSLATFKYYQTQSYDNWVGSYLYALPNDNLSWQKTHDYNIGFDLNVGGRINVRYDCYVQKTKDQVLALTIPPSMGFTSYMENLGSTENKGMEFKINAHVWKDVEQDRYLSAFFSIAHNENKLKKLSNALKNYNDEMDKELVDGKTNRPQLHFIEGKSMNSIWAVRSLGIDPATGREIFLDRNNNITTKWEAVDQVVCGDAMPRYTGTFGVNVDIRGIFLNTTFYYRMGGQIYNQTLVDRVENADISLNVDKRIYDAVWKQPGDKVSFAYNPYIITRPSSRFVYDLNELQLASLNVGYDFKHCAFIKKAKLEQLKVSFYMNDVFRASTVKTERGLSYPFARTYSFTIQTTF